MPSRVIPTEATLRLSAHAIFTLDNSHQHSKNKNMSIITWNSICHAMK